MTQRARMSVICLFSISQNDVPQILFYGMLRSIHAKSWLIGEDSDAGRDWGQEEKGTTEDKMVGWHHWLDGRESAWTLGVGDGQGGLACCDSWGRKESDTTERLNWAEEVFIFFKKDYKIEDKFSWQNKFVNIVGLFWTVTMLIYLEKL